MLSSFSRLGLAHRPDEHRELDGPRHAVRLDELGSVEAPPAAAPAPARPVAKPDVADPLTADLSRLHVDGAAPSLPFG
jgi:hypothetical protein